MKKFLTVTVAALSAVSLAASAAQAGNIGKLQALGAARVVSSTGGFSRAGLINQLTPHTVTASRKQKRFGASTRLRN